MVTISVLHEASNEAVRDINLLLKQLRSDKNEPDATLSELQEIVGDKNVVFVVVKDGERIVGMATLYMITKFGKRGGFIEDVVVDEVYRGQGLGEKVTQALIDAATAEKLGSIYLTSRPERVAANKLYQKLGFKQKETNVYKMTLLAA
jgi:ribosomal protein S18 acetylase RimI-like enzyme